MVMIGIGFELPGIFVSITLKLQAAFTYYSYLGSATTNSRVRLWAKGSLPLSHQHY